MLLDGSNRRQRIACGTRNQWITTDGDTGLHQALQIVYPEIVLRRWWGHKSRNILDKVKRADQSAVKKALN